MGKLEEREANSSPPEAHSAAPRVLSVREDDYCFACGSENPIGLKLNLRLFGEQVQGVFTPAAEHQGFVGIIHGGLITLVLDETMAKLLSLQGIEALTCELVVRLHTIARVGEPLHVTAWWVGERKRVLELRAQAVLACGERVATASGKFLRVGERRLDSRRKREPMPIYEYRCEGCGQISEVLVRNARETSAPKCEHCGDSRLERAYHSPIAPVPNGRSSESSPCCGKDQGCADPKRCCQR